MGFVLSENLRDFADHTFHYSNEVALLCYIFFSHDGSLSCGSSLLYTLHSFRFVLGTCKSFKFHAHRIRMLIKELYPLWCMALIHFTFPHKKEGIQHSRGSLRKFPRLDLLRER